MWVRKSWSVCTCSLPPALEVHLFRPETGSRCNARYGSVLARGISSMIFFFFFPFFFFFFFFFFLIFLKPLGKIRVFWKKNVEDNNFPAPNDFWKGSVPWGPGVPPT